MSFYDNKKLQTVNFLFAILFLEAILCGVRGCSSGVERNLAKVDVARSNRVARSQFQVLKVLVPIV